MNTKYNDLLSAAYANYEKAYEADNTLGLTLLVAFTDGRKAYKKPSLGQFEALISINKIIAEKWQAKIETRDMTWEERVQWVMKYTGTDWENLSITEEAQKPTTPTRVTILTYNGQSGFKYE
jgi:hypothetical protein